jgi:hypothetical protein
MTVISVSSDRRKEKCIQNFGGEMCQKVANCKTKEKLGGKY